MLRESLSHGWLFSRGGDDGFESVIIPHDGMLGAPRSAGAPSGSAQGYFEGGTYTYRRAICAKRRGGCVLLEFEGVYRDAVVRLDGRTVASHGYGYVPFVVDVSRELADGAPHSLEVSCSNAQQPDSHWYTGAGIYRPAWLWEGPRDCHVAPWDVRVQTVSAKPARVRVRVDVPAGTDVHVEVFDGDTLLGTGSGASPVIELGGAEPWSDERPNLYLCRVTCGRDGASNQAEVRFGIRDVSVLPGEGLRVNGREVLLRGGCVHQDLGVLGSAAFDDAEYRRVELTKKAGYNAIRSAHNPANRALLDACDELGVYVLDEAWDMWFQHKGGHDYAGSWRGGWRKDIDAMVSRDFNHPCVIGYSIGNELSEPVMQGGMEVAREVVERVRRDDSSRFVTCGFNLVIAAMSKSGHGLYDGAEKDQGETEGQTRLQGMSSTAFNMLQNLSSKGTDMVARSRYADKVSSPFFDLLDVAGYNYGTSRYEKDARLHPKRVIMGTKTPPGDIYRNWQLVKRLPNVIGDFMRTAWDYLGEAGLGAWTCEPDGRSFDKPYPWLLADTGAFDILGNPNGELFLARAAWGLDAQPQICVRPLNRTGRVARNRWRSTDALPSWGWKGCEGRTAHVEVYSSAESVALLLNGEPVGTRRVCSGVARFECEYQPGTVTAVALDGSGREVGRSSIASADAARLSATVQDHAGPGRLAFVSIDLADADGNIESNADARIEVDVEGGVLLGLGSARLRSEGCSSHTGARPTLDMRLPS